MPDIFANTTLAVLAGGEGSRMGQAKGLLTIGGRPILEHILQNARWPGRTMLVTAPGRELPPGGVAFDIEVVDPVGGCGPMRGVLTALEHAQTDQVVVMPVDMPAMEYEPLRWLAERLFDLPEAIAVLLEHSGIVEPLPAAFRRSARTVIAQRLEANARSLRRLVESNGVQLCSAPESWPASIWINLNSPDDLAHFEATPMPSPWPSPGVSGGGNVNA